MESNEMCLFQLKLMVTCSGLSFMGLSEDIH